MLKFYGIAFREEIVDEGRNSFFFLLNFEINKISAVYSIPKRRGNVVQLYTTTSISSVFRIIPSKRFINATWRTLHHDSVLCRCRNMIHTVMFIQFKKWHNLWSILILNYISTGNVSLRKKNNNNRDNARRTALSSQYKCDTE